MRRAYSNVDFIGEEDKNNFIGISLGYDYCAEHEWGIKGIKYAFGMPDELKPENFGLSYRTISKFDEKRLKFFKHENKVKKVKYSFAFLIFSKYNDFGLENLPYPMKNYQEEMIPSEYEKEGKELITAWAEDDFCIIVRDEKNVKNLEEIFEALKSNDICIGMFGGAAFENAHLTIAIKSRMPQYVDDNLKKSDLESFETAKIRKDWEEKVEKSGKKNFEDYMCVSPRFFDFFDKKEENTLMKKNNTKYRFNFWINASGDNYGWYTGEQVEEWMKGKKQLKDLRK